MEKCLTLLGRGFSGRDEQRQGHLPVVMISPYILSNTFKLLLKCKFLDNPDTRQSRYLEIEPF